MFDSDNLVKSVTLDELIKFHEAAFGVFRFNPVGFVTGVYGIQPDPWQCDVLDALADPEVFNVAIMSCRGGGKTALLSWAMEWFFLTRWGSEVVSTAPTFNKQVRDVLWGQGMHFWWSKALAKAPFLDLMFECTTTRLHARDIGSNKLSAFWFATGVASKTAANLEGYRAQNILIVFDEAKTIAKPVWDAVWGMRSATTEPKWLVASSPGGPTMEHSKIFTTYRTTWKRTFSVHPFCLKSTLKSTPTGSAKEPIGLNPVTGKKVRGRFSKFGGAYYSKRAWATLLVSQEQAVSEREGEWGADSPAYQSHVEGNIPTMESNRLIRWDHIMNAVDRDECVAPNCTCSTDGVVVVSCDVARTGMDRTVIFASRGGKVLHGEAVSREPKETTAEEMHTIGVGADRNKPQYRAIWATADICERVAIQLGATIIVVDDIGMGGGVTDELRKRGWNVVAFNASARPTDIPKDKDSRDWKIRRLGRETAFKNLKAQAGWSLRNAFEHGHICLDELDVPGQTKNALLDPLVAQLGAVRQRTDDNGYLRVESPDGADEADATYFDDPAEAKRSPDHFYSLMMNWWVAGGGHKVIRAQAGAADRHRSLRIGRPTAKATPGPGTVQNQPVSSSGIANAKWLDKLV